MMLVPGPLMRQGTVRMGFEYADYFGRTVNTGYETLLYDCMIGDATLFQRAENVEAAWRVVQPILDGWREADGGAPLARYRAGSVGPIEAEGPLPPISAKVRSSGATVTPLAMRNAVPLKAIRPPSVTMKLGICP